MSGRVRLMVIHLVRFQRVNLDFGTDVLKMQRSVHKGDLYAHDREHVAGIHSCDLRFFSVQINAVGAVAVLHTQNAGLTAKDKMTGGDKREF